MYKQIRSVEDVDCSTVAVAVADNTEADLITQIGYIAARVRHFDELYSDTAATYSNAYGLTAAIIFDADDAAADDDCCDCDRSSAAACSSAAATAATTTATATTTTASLTSRKRTLEDLVIKFYEEQDRMRRRKQFKDTKDNKFIMNSGSVEKLLPISSDDNEAATTTTTSTTNALKTSNICGSVAAAGAPDNSSQNSNNNNSPVANATATATTATSTLCSNNKLSPFGGIGDATTTAVQIAFNNHPGRHLHRGSCSAATDSIFGGNTIGHKSAIILSKSCSNVDGGGTTNGCSGGDNNGGVRGLIKLDDVVTAAAAALHGSSSFVSNSSCNNLAGKFGANPCEFSLVQLNNTIIQCQFNNDDLRALVKDLKRKVEYTERMNWLSLSKRPMGPPHRKSSLPKHAEVKKRFLEICDTTFSDEVKAALRLPAFDSYEWEDAAVIHLMQTMFTELGFIEKFNIPVGTLREWLYEVYKHYNEVPFHNFRHCFCVAQMMYAITRQANLITRLGELECMVLLVSCICHDLDHPGYNNIYQINARTELALRYNDISPLENHHCSIAFRLLEHPDCNIFKNFNRETFNVIREGIIRCILATDMARHNEILTQFKDAVPVFDYSNRSHINLLCMILIKVADISNEARPMDVAEPWLDRLLQEFFAQSAAEKSEGLPVTPFMDPDKVSKPGSQVRFIGLVLLPLFEALGDLLPDLTELIIIPVRVALDYYKRLNDAQNKSRKSIAETAENTSSDGGGISPQLPRSQSGISVKSRRSIPSQKSASRTSVDEPTCIAAELHDLPEGSESGDSETATEVDVAEKTSKFKVDTEGSSNRSKSSHSTSRKSSREKRPSMIGEICSSGGNRTRNSYGNIHGYHPNRCHFGSNRAVSLDQYSCNNRRLSDGLQQVISDSNVFYNRHNHRGSTETTNNDPAAVATAAASAERPIMEAANVIVVGEDVLNMNTNPCYDSTRSGTISSATTATTTATTVHSNNKSAATAAASAAATNGNCSQSAAKSWKTRFKQITDYFSFSFEKGNKRFASTRSSPCSMRNNNAAAAAAASNNSDLLLPSKPGSICCTISNNLSPSLRHKQHELIGGGGGGRNRAYSLDVPSRNRYSSSSGGGDSRKSSRNEETATNSSTNNRHDLLAEDNNSNNTSSGECGGAGAPRLGSDCLYSGSIGSAEHSIDMGIIASGSSDPAKI